MQHWLSLIKSDKYFAYLVRTARIYLMSSSTPHSTYTSITNSVHHSHTNLNSWEAFRSIICCTLTANHIITSILCNGTCWMAWRFSKLHIHTFCILTWSLRWGSSVMDNSCGSMTVVHILQQPLSKMNFYCIIWLIKLIHMHHFIWTKLCRSQCNSSFLCQAF
jgi:hypothetical protein